MILFEGVVEEDSHAETSAKLTPTKTRPSAKDAYAVFEDLCILVSNGLDVNGAHTAEPKFLTLSNLPPTFGLELIESVLSDFAPVFLLHPALLDILRHLLSPLLINGLSPTNPSHRLPQFSTTLRLMRVAFLLLKQFNNELIKESEILLRLFIKFVEGTVEEPPISSWSRVLALEIFRGLCNDFDLMRKVWLRYDAATADSQEGVFTTILSALSHLSTEKPQLLGVAPTSRIALPGSTGFAGLVPGGVAGDAVNGMIEMAAQAASSVGGMSGLNAVAGLTIETASMKLQW